MTLTGILTTSVTLTQGMRIPCVALTFAALLFGLIKAFQTGTPQPLKERRRYLPWLAGICAAAVILRIFIYPHHAGLMNDDMYFAQNARQMIDFSFIPINNFLTSTGWPFLVSLGFWVTGPNQYTLYFTNSILGCLSVLILFFLVYGITGKSAPGLAAAAFLAVHPGHTLWSTGGASIVPSICFLLLSLTALFWFFRDHNEHYILVSVFAAAFAAQINPLNLLLFLFIPAAMFFLGRELFVARKVLAGLLPALLLTIPNMLFQLSLKLLDGMPQGGSLKAALDYDVLARNLLNSLSTGIAEMANSGNFTMVLAGFAAAGLVLGWKKYSGTIVCFALLFAAYFALIRTFPESAGYAERFALYTDLALILIGAMCVPVLWDNFSQYKTPILAGLILIPTVFSAGPHRTNANPGNQYFLYGKNMSEAIDKIQTTLPRDAIVIIEDPAPLQAVTDIRVIDSNTVMNQAAQVLSSGPVYYLLDMSAASTSPAFLDMFTLKLVIPVSLGSANPCNVPGGLYRVTAGDTAQQTIPDTPEQ